jgi:hypothetical protein
MLSEFPQRDFEPPREPQPRGRRRKRRAAGLRTGIGVLSLPLALLGLGAAAAAGAIFALDIPRRAASAPSTAVAAAQAPVRSPLKISPDNPIGLKAQEAGIVDCLPQIANVAQFLTRGSTAQWVLTHGENADRTMFSATIAAREDATGIGGISNLYATPTGAGRCNLGYESTIYFPMSCAEAHAQAFANVATSVPLGSDVVEAFRAAGDGGRLYLMPAGPSGCVAVKTEIFY